MKDGAYHHGNLHTELVEGGLLLIHDEGKGNFSLRKLSKKIGVSPTACYNHYPTVEDLLQAMQTYVTDKFCDVLLKEVEEAAIEHVTIRMGKAYVDFFAKHPHYFSFIYENDNCNISLSDTSFTGDYKPFCIFQEYAIASMQSHQVDTEKQLDNLVVMWAIVHGLAAMANMKGFQYDGDWRELTERLLLTKINL